jgi:type VI secretion system protein ImpC
VKGCGVPKLEASGVVCTTCASTPASAADQDQGFHTTKKELVRDFKTAIDFDQSTLFKKVYEEEFGTFGGAPLAR